MTVEIPLYVRPAPLKARWIGEFEETRNVVKVALQALTMRWWPERLYVVEGPFDADGEPEEKTTQRSCPLERFTADFTEFEDVRSILAMGIICVRVVIAEPGFSAEVIRFEDPDQIVRTGTLYPAAPSAGQPTRWLDPGCSLMRGFSLDVPALGEVDIQWDKGPFSTEYTPSVWTEADSRFDKQVESSLREIGFGRT